MDLIGLTVAKLFSTSLFEREGEAIQSVDLGPIHEPDAVQFSFDTPGWYILGGLLFLSTVLFFVRWLKHFQKNAYRRKALNDIKIIENQQQNESCINDVFVLLRIVAMTAFGRKSVARLYGGKQLYTELIRIEKQLKKGNAGQLSFNLNNWSTARKNYMSGIKGGHQGETNIWINPGKG